MPDEKVTAPDTRADKSFTDWITSIIEGKVEASSSLQNRLKDVHQKHQKLVAEARQAEATLVQAKGQIARFEGAAEQLVDLLREDFVNGDAPESASAPSPAPQA